MAAGAGQRLLVVGTGLIGTSIALAATAAGYEVWLDDRAADELGIAVALGAGRRRDGGMPRIDLAVVAIPPKAIAGVVHDLVQSDIAATITHTASVQLLPQAEVETKDGRLPQFVGGHPFAGRERSGAHHASADLFRERPWFVCATSASTAEAVASVEALAAACGSSVARLTAGAHDELLARLSHVPQLVASALAGSLGGLRRDDAALGGAGLRDTSRLADGDPALWAQIIGANPAAVAAALRDVVDPLATVLGVLETLDSEEVEAAIRQLVASGRAGRALLAGKHGQPAVRWTSVSVVVPDEPGALARLLVDAAAAEVNVEDIRVDHSPGQSLGIVELDVRVGAAETLERALAAKGWAAGATRSAGEEDG